MPARAQCKRAMRFQYRMKTTKLRLLDNLYMIETPPSRVIYIYDGHQNQQYLIAGCRLLQQIHSTLHLHCWIAKGLRPITQVFHVLLPNIWCSLKHIYMCSLRTAFLARYSVKYDVRLFLNVSTSSMQIQQIWW